MKFFIIAGEASADIHAAHLAKELLKIYPDATFYGTGGIHLKEIGQEQYFTVSDMAIIGFIEVIKKLPLVFRLFKEIPKLVESVQPDAIILLDYPGFNLRIMKKLKKFQKPIIYFIPPQFWIWRYSRIFTLKKYADIVLSILPFEKEFLDKEGVPNAYVGNPTVDNFNFKYESKEALLNSLGLDSNMEVIGILPGSRMREISSLMPAFVMAMRNYPNKSFIISKADNIAKGVIDSYIPSDMQNVRILESAQYDIIKYSSFLWACSGTITLEAAILEKPMIICYHASRLNVAIIKRFTKLRYIGLPNIVAGEQFIPEVHCIGGSVANGNLVIKKYEEALEKSVEIEEKLKSISSLFKGLNPSKEGAKIIENLLSIKN